MAALQSNDSPAICTITRGEILYGLERIDEGRRRQTLLTQANEYFKLLICIPVTEAVGDRYAKIKRDTERKGMSLDEKRPLDCSNSLKRKCNIGNARQRFQSRR